MSSPTPNKGYTYPAHGGATNAWDTPLNTNFDQIDLNVAGYYPITITSTASTVTFNSSYAVASSTAATITPPSSIAQNLTYALSGTLTQNTKLVLPAAGGLYDIYNNTSGSFTLTVGSSTGTSATVNQGGTNLVTCYDGTNFILSNSNPVAAKFYTQLGNPNGSVAGNVGSVNGGFTDAIWDATNRQLYAVTTGSSLAASTVWSPQISRLEPQGYLTLSNSTTSPIVATDTTAATLYYTPLNGAWTVLSTGTLLFPYQFSQMSLALTASQAASNIYDIFMWWNSGSPIIGTGPSWSAGGGSVSAGSCARGTGAGSTALTRLSGVLVNSVQVSLLNNVTTYTCPAKEGVYLGSIFINTSAGQVSCYRSWGQSRKWGVWNMYNRRLISMMGGDSTASWAAATASFRASNNNSANVITGFCGLAEDAYSIQFNQYMYVNGVGLSTGQEYCGIGVNSTTVASGFNGASGSLSFASGVTGPSVYCNGVAQYLNPPSLGINNFYMLEKGPATGTGTFYGTNANMQMTVECWA